MARITVTFEDKENNTVGMAMDFDPPFDPSKIRSEEEVSALTEAEKSALMVFCIFGPNSEFVENSKIINIQ